jgi:polyribonucleotide 5'-hydroxyl-kinase
LLTLAVNVLLVLGSERLYSEMKRRFPPSNHERAVTVIRLDKSGGCVDRDEDYMRKLRQIQVREYFYGQPSMALSPTTQVVDFSQIAIFRISNGSSQYLSAFLTTTQPPPRPPSTPAPTPTKTTSTTRRPCQAAAPAAAPARQRRCTKR